MRERSPIPGRWWPLHYWRASLFIMQSPERVIISKKKVNEQRRQTAAPAAMRWRPSLKTGALEFGRLFGGRQRRALIGRPAADAGAVGDRTKTATHTHTHTHTLSGVCVLIRRLCAPWFIKQTRRRPVCKWATHPPPLRVPITNISISITDIFQSVWNEHKTRVGQSTRNKK